MRVPLRKLLCASAWVTAMLLVATVMATPEPVPFIETFDGRTLGNLDGQGPWTTNGFEDASAVVQNVDYVVGAKGATTDMADLTLNVAGEPNNIWCKIWAKPTLYDDSSSVPAPHPSVSAAFYVNTGGVVKAYNGTAWQSQGTAPTDGHWLGFAVHSDYVSKTWNLYMRQDGYGAHYVKVNGAPLDFRTNTTATYLSAVTISGVAHIDALALGKGVKAPDVGGANVIVTALSFGEGEQKAVGLQPHAYAETENSLAPDKDLGKNLLVWLSENDSVTVRDTANVTYVHEGTGWDVTTDMPIYPGSAVWISKAAPGGALTMFMDYNTLTAHEPVLYGKTAGGMTFLAWDKPEESLPLDQTDAGFADRAGTGDRLYVTGPNGLKMLFWHNATQRWRDGANAATDRLAPGTAFWYYRGSDFDNDAWNLPAAQ